MYLLHPAGEGEPEAVPEQKKRTPPFSGVQLRCFKRRKPGQQEHGERDQEPRHQHQHPHQRRQRVHEGEQLDGLGGRRHVEDGDAQVQERHGEVHRRLTLRVDGEVADGQVRPAAHHVPDHPGPGAVLPVAGAVAARQDEAEVEADYPRHLLDKVDGKALVGEAARLLLLRLHDVGVAEQGCDHQCARAAAL